MQENRHIVEYWTQKYEKKLFWDRSGIPENI